LPFEPAFLHHLPLHPIPHGDGRPDGLRVSGNADRLVDIFLRDPRIDGTEGALRVRYPPHVPERVRVAWMQTGESPEQADLVFATRDARKDYTRINLDLLCPTETAEGKRAGTTCSSCQFCWKQ
jgi:hypothetical protein